MANAVTAFLDDPAARRGDELAIGTSEGRVSYHDLLALVNRTGHVLRGLGVEPEQRVAIVVPDGLAWVAAFFGALRIGAVAVPLNTRLARVDWVELIRDSRARVVIADATVADDLREALRLVSSVKAVLSAGPSAGPRGLEGLTAKAPSTLAPEAVSGDDMAFWLYTSGTTGQPKAAVHLHRDLLACRHYGVEVLGATAADRVFATSKLFFAYALGNALLSPLYLGGRTFLSPAWPDPGTVADVVAGFRPTLFFSVPTFYARLLQAELPRDLFRSVRCAVSAGERLPEEIHARFAERFGVEILDGLGATETIFMVLSNRRGQVRPGSCGLPVPGTSARLLDAEGREVAPGEQGVLHVRTPSASPAYWARVDQSRRTFVGEWFRTGDICRRDGDGYYYHCGRADDLFKVAGLWVAPAEVEAVLMSHPGVADVGVVGLEEAPSGLVKPFAFVVPREAARPARPLVDELTALLAERLPPHQRPRRITVVPELPRTTTGKLQRFLLRERGGAS